MDLKSISAHLNAVVSEEAVLYARDIEKLVDSLLKELRIDYNEVPRTYLEEAAYNAAKDIYKMALYHPDGLEPLKTFGYMCFWVRKIKPVLGATRQGKPCREVNELLSIHMAASLCVRYSALYPEDIPNRDKDAVKRRAKAFLGDKRRMDYLVHCMRYRTFGPHHYVMILQNIVYGFD